MQRVSVYIDGANFSYGIRSINKRYSDFKFDFGRYIKFITKGRLLGNIYYYNASFKYDINPGLFKQQQKLFNRLRDLEKFNVILCKRQQITKDDGSCEFKIKGDDINLAIDMLRDAYEKKYDDAILISGDGDFKPLVEYVRKLGKHVENHYFKDNISLDLLKSCNTSTLIDKKIVNKFFYREKQMTLVGDTIMGKKIFSNTKGLQ
jgi:uncharacterized LabA/DUF88 family protein